MGKRLSVILGVAAFVLATLSIWSIYELLRPLFQWMQQRFGDPYTGPIILLIVSSVLLAVVLKRKLPWIAE